MEGTRRDSMPRGVFFQVIKVLVEQLDGQGGVRNIRIIINGQRI